MSLTIESATRKDRASGTNTVLQHRHFAFIAATIEDMPEKYRWITATSFADALASSNPRFDRRRFLTACGVEE